LYSSLVTPLAVMANNKMEPEEMLDTFAAVFEKMASQFPFLKNEMNLGKGLPVVRAPAV